MADKRRRVVDYKKPININIGIIIFGITFLYILINVFVFLSKDKISYYEVVNGQSAQVSNYSYTGLAIRSEKVSYTQNAGNINYYVREGSRVSASSTLYSIDETGVITQLLAEQSSDEVSLSDDDLSTIKEQLYNFTNNFDSMNYGTVYDFKSTIEGTVIELVNSSLLKSIYKSAGESEDSNAFQINKAGSFGIVVYSIDNYEDFKISKVSAADFDKNNYTKASFSSGDLIEEGSPIYKTINDEEWNIIIPLTEEDIDKYSDTDNVKIKFVKDGITASANFEIFKGSDGKYAKLTLNKYLIRYVTERYIDIQILDDNITGLKIPKSSVTSNDFYIIPADYAAYGGDDDNLGFYHQVYKDGKISTEFVTPTIFYSDDDYYYIDMDAYDNDDVFIKPDSDETYQLNATQSLLGVYNINSGYTEFVQINILAETNEYYIVESQTTYGLIIYDHIIMDASTVKNHQVIFQ
ncbi:MAG: HlyD family efflux transporter periplasmic adaptor subunit [Eubacterium sp.]